MNTLIKSPVDFIESRTWYQTIDFGDGIKSKGYPWCGDPVWKNILSLLPKSLEGTRILDLGCNAGIFCVRAAMKGAREVIGVDWTGWRPDWDFIEQQDFVKSYFEDKLEVSLPITYYNEQMEVFLRRQNLGKFDHVFALASLYYTQDPQEVVRRIADITGHVIARLRDENILTRFKDLFKRVGFVEEKVIKEDWNKVLNEPADDFYLFSFRKQDDLEVLYYQIVKGHKEISGSDDLLDIWQLMDLVGAELPLEGYLQRIPVQYLDYIPLRKFARMRYHKGLTPFKPTKEMLEAYPWEALRDSVKDLGIVIPVIVEETDVEGEKLYISLEGRHRVAALSMIQPFNPNLMVPCIIVKQKGKRV